MSKLEKREQKNLETAFFREKERVIELEELVQQQKFVVGSSYVSGYLEFISELFGLSKNWTTARFVFEKTPKHKVIKDFSDKDHYFLQKESDSALEIEPFIQIWLDKKLLSVASRFLVPRVEQTEAKLNDLQMKHFIELLGFFARKVSFDIAFNLTSLAKSISEDQKTWMIYQEKNEPESLIFDFSTKDPRIQCALHMYEEIA